MKKSLLALLCITAIFAVNVPASAQQEVNTHYVNVIKQKLAAIPKTIECYSVVQAPRSDNPNDPEALAEHIVFTLANSNLKLAEAGQFMENSVLVYASTTTGVTVIVDARRQTVLAVAGSLKQPNTCKAGVSIK